MGSSQPWKYRKLTLVFERRFDGGLRVYSDDVPGFVLSHANAAAAIADVQPALECILSEMFHTPVSVSPLGTLNEELEEAGVIDPPPKMARREYVAHLTA
jgi:hypothetical protein